jgi:hypothetical protein
MFRVHPGIEHDFGSLGFEEVRIRADTGVATETFKDHDRSRKKWDHGGRWPCCQPTLASAFFRCLFRRVKKVEYLLGWAVPKEYRERVLKFRAFGY